MDIHQLAELLDGQVENSNDIEITGVNTLQNACESDASFLANMHYRELLDSTHAGAILVGSDLSIPPSCQSSLIRVENPYLAFARLQRHFNPQPVASGERHRSAAIDSSALLAESVEVGANSVIGKNVSIGAGTIIGAGCVIEADVVIGENCLLHSGSVVCHQSVLGDRVILQAGAVIGSDGFGYAWSGKEHLKIPQTGRALLEDDVEIGANTTIDRGALGDTIIRRGAKLDNQIQVGHNVEVGAYTVMASQVGISGSTRVGAGCQFGGQAGVAGHINIGDGVRLAAKSGVMSDLEAGQAYAGLPAMPHRAWLRMSAILEKLPEIWKTVKNLNKQS